MKIFSEPKTNCKTINFTIQKISKPFLSAHSYFDSIGCLIRI